LFTGGGGAGWPVMARRRISPAVVRARMERCVSGVEKRKKGEAGLGLGSCRGKGRRGGACRGGGGHQWP
jgi:hypothetical protein